MRSHFFLMVLFSSCVALVFSQLMRDKFEYQVRLGMLLWAGFVVAALFFAWLMYPMPL